MSGKAERGGFSMGIVLASLAAIGASLVAGTPWSTAAEPFRVLRVEYRTRGAVPGTSLEKGKAASVLQRITVDPSGRRLLYEESEEVPRRDAAGEEVPGTEIVPGRKCILRMDRSPPVIHEILEGGKAYREHAGDLNELQKDRRIAEQDLLKLARDQATPKEYERILKDNYLKPNLERHVTIRREPGAMILDRQCERIVVEENGRLIVDAQVTRDAPGSRSYYELYRRLGAFSEEVLEKLSGVEGLPLRARITVVTALPAYTFDVDALKIETVAADERIFELPPGARKVEDIPREATCHRCGKKIEDVEYRLFDTDAKKVLYFCGAACLEAHQEESLQGKAPGKKR
jgi:hypothetical protein